MKHLSVSKAGIRSSNLRSYRLGALVLVLILGFFGHSDARAAEPYANLVRTFKKLTEVKQKRWSEENEDRYVVEGSGKVETVEEAGVISEIQGDYYEVTIEISGGDRAVVFYPKSFHRAADLDKGDRVSFRGRLKRLKDWGFWVSGYLVGDQLR